MKHASPVVAACLAVGLAIDPGWAGEALPEGGRIGALEADLLSHDSATETLGRWCADLNLASPPVIRAVRVRGAEKIPDAGIRALLGARRHEAIRYRRVRLVCGDHILSQADNWYLPARLSADMNRRLDETDTPFGAVVRPLAFHRRTLETKRLSGAGGILRVRAVLINGAGAPFSAVVETYTRDLLASSPPP